MKVLNGFQNPVTTRGIDLVTEENLLQKGFKTFINTRPRLYSLLFVGKYQEDLNYFSA